MLGAQAASIVPHYYPFAYAAMTVVVALATWTLWRGREISRPHGRLADAILVGVLGIGIWIALDHFNVEQAIAAWLPQWLRPSTRPAFNPFEALDSPALAWSFVAVRLAGLVLIVPVIEELFWRGFLLRWLISNDWEEVPVGAYTPGSFFGVSVLFALAHPEWLSALLYCALLNGYLYWRKDLWRCMAAHGVSNLVLAVYILATGAWRLW